MTDSWRIFHWASLHSSEFQHCYIRLPIALNFRAGQMLPGQTPFLSIGILLQPLSVFLPYTVSQAYYASKRQELDEFDDIPF